MADPIGALEAKREALLKEIARVGDIRRGSITETFRPCGKPNCGCSAAEHPGHGPYYAFTTKVAGKTKTVQLRAGSRLAKFQREVEAYRRFRSLTEQLLEINAAICDARPGEAGEPSERARLKKTSPRSSRTRSRVK
jgi:uncharacterized protein DUF6788